MIYREAAKYLDDGPGTLRNRIYNSRKGSSQNLKQLKQVYALVCETLKYKTALTTIMNSSQILKRERKLCSNTALIMIYDLLLGSKRLNCGKCFEKDAVIRHKTRLNAEMVKYRLKIPKLTDEVTADEPPVRWIRINKGILPNDSPAAMFERLGLTEVDDWSNVTAKTWYKDTFIPYLYAIHPSVPMNKLPEYKKGAVIVQDRASCIPVTIMDPQNEGRYIDTCAAPGNKTSQLAMGAKNVIAFERDPKRAQTLHKMLEVAHLLDKVDVKVKDFTQFQPLDEPFAGIIVDPSCSGSGIFRSTKVTKERLENLSEFQYRIMLHALKFNAQKVVYSTCSIHAEENEHVVKKLLATPEVADRWRLSSRENVLPQWPRRGLTSEFDGAEACVRVNPREDGGIGFFAACFERI